MKIFNSKTRKKEEFTPHANNKVTIYACGPTVYDYFHVGNARTFVIFDLLRRYLEYKGYEVIFVQNFTDIDDKMIQRANEEGISVNQLAERFIAAYKEDSKSLGVTPATIHPRATEHIPEIIDLIQTLIDKGNAYEINGNVYFKVRSFPRYGELSGQNIDDLEEGASKRLRNSDEQDKSDPLDFSLWKKHKQGEPFWDSPWGKGRPGWHIECSAMSLTHLGHPVDIHCGGCDLIFPHHENEVAQSEGAMGNTYVNYWMHNGFINVDNEKMSKSKNNFFTINDIRKEYDLEVVRMFLISSHYRNPINYTKELLDQSHNSLKRLYNAKSHMEHLKSHINLTQLQDHERAFINTLPKFKKDFEKAMDDDLNTADALGVLFELTRAINSELNEKSSLVAVEEAEKTFLTLANILNIATKSATNIPEFIKALLDERAKAREEKNWQRSDELRVEIQSAGFTVEDTPQGQKIKNIGL